MTFVKSANGTTVEYLRRNVDEAAIIAALAHSAYVSSASALSDQDHQVLAALRRSNPDLADAPMEDVQNYLQTLDDEQRQGLVSNVKGILHEMEFVRLENEDGDSIYAAMFDKSDHPDTDVMFVNQDTGESWEVQLKSTNSESYVQDWIDDHPGGEIIVTEELADEMDLPGSGQSNEQLTAKVSDFVDRMVESDEHSSLWNYFPALSIVSVSIIVFELWNRYRCGEIDGQEFKNMAALATGLKVTKIAALTFLLTIPVLGQATGALLIAKLLVNASRAWYDKPPRYVPAPALPAG